MAEHGIEDHSFAKRKAAARFGMTETSPLPTNSEVDSALAEYQRLFAAPDHRQTLNAQRLCAVEAMRLLQRFNPKLVGPILNGSATPHQTITLHLFSDSVEAVSIELIDRKVPYRLTEQQIKMSRERQQRCPVVCFSCFEFSIEAIVFPTDGDRQAPLSAIDGRPMRRGTLSEVIKLLGPHV